MARTSTAQRLKAQVEAERLARIRSEGIAEGLERALRLMLGAAPSGFPPRPFTPGPRGVRGRALAGTPGAAKASRTASKPPSRKPAAAPAVRRPRATRPPPSGRARPPAAAPLPPPPPATPEATPGGLNTLLSGPPAQALEVALARVQASEERSFAERAAAGEVLARVRPWVVWAARAEYARRAGRFGVEEQELVAVGLGAVHQHMRRFRPGRAGAGRTLFPAYALRVARQAFWRLVQERRSPVPLTSWGLKLRRKALRRVAAQGGTLREALEAEGASPGSLAALVEGSIRTIPISAQRADRSRGRVHTLNSGAEFGSGLDPGAEGDFVQQLSEETYAEQEAHHAHQQLGDDALAALTRLPEDQRTAVAGTLGLHGPAMPARALARRMGCTPQDVEALFARGLASLRAALEAP